jgi:hypothetical protein
VYRVLVGVADDGHRAGDQQPSQVSIALLGSRISHCSNPNNHFRIASPESNFLEELGTVPDFLSFDYLATVADYLALWH